MVDRWMLAGMVVACLAEGLVAEDKLPKAPVDPVASIREHRQRGRYEEALDAAEQRIKTAPGDRAATVERSRVLLETGQLGSAETLLGKLVEREATAGEWAWLAQVQFARGRWQEAATSAGKALALEDSEPRARLIQAHLLAGRGDLDGANEAYRWFVRYYNRAQPKDAETLLLVAQGSAEYARWNGVSQIFEFVVNTLCPDALAADPACWQAHWIAGTLLLEKYNEAEGLPELNSALAINPQAVELHLALARVKLDNREYLGAEQALAAARETWPDCPAAAGLEAAIRLAMDDPAGARKVLSPALAAAPHETPLLARLAVCDLMEDGEPSPQVLGELLDGFAKLGTAPAVAGESRFAGTLRRVSKQNPRAGEFFTIVADALESRRRFALAERFYKLACEVAPQRGDCRSSLGLLYMNMGRTDEARKVLDEALRKDPYHVRASNMRKVIDVLDSYPPITTDHFVIRVDSKVDVVMGRMIGRFLEREYPQLIAKYGYEPAARTQFEIYNKSKGRSGHEWFSTRMIGLPWIQTIGASTGMMVALASPTSSDRPYNWARVLRHEYVHILTLQRTDFRIPHWFTEALAVESEQQPRPESWDLLMVKRHKAGQLYTLDSVNRGFTQAKNADDWTQAYSQSQWYHQYLIEKFGAEAPLKLLAAFVTERDVGAAIKLATGIDKAAFEAGYRASLDQLVAETSRVAELDLPKPAEAEKRHAENPDDNTAAGQYAWLQFEGGNRKVARTVAEEVHKRDKTEPWSALTLASLARRAEDQKQALELLTGAWNADAPASKIVDLKGLVHLEQKDYPAAIATYAAGLKRRPRQVEWWKKKAVAELRSQQTGPLKASLEEIARLDVDDLSVRRKRADLAWEEGDADGAARFAEAALEIDVRPVELHVLAARALGRSEQPVEALFFWENALLLEPRTTDWFPDCVAAVKAAGPAAQKRLQELATAHPANTLIPRVLAGLAK
jgi:cellulose synthase operon protein C